MNRVWNYLFVKKDPWLMACAWRKPLGFAMMVFGVVNIAISLTILLR